MRNSGGWRVTSALNRTQEVGGSNPPSSIAAAFFTLAEGLGVSPVAVGEGEAANRQAGR